MQIDKLFDKECELIQQQKKLFNEMNVCATKTFNIERYAQLIDEYNATVKKRHSVIQQIQQMKTSNMESMELSLKQHYHIE